MFLFVTLEQKLKQMSKFEFSSGFIVNVIKLECCTFLINKMIYSLMTKALKCFHEVLSWNLGKLWNKFHMYDKYVHHRCMVVYG
jgi:hypothetical protein